MRFFRKFLFVVFIIFLSALGGILGNRILFPWLASFEQLSILQQFARNNGTTIINPTEQIIVNESEGFERAVALALPYLVLVEREGSKTAVSGVAVTEDGLVATDAQIAVGRGQLFVVRHNERFAATLVRVDASSNTALVKIDSHNLSFPDFDDSVNLGQALVAVRMVNEEQMAVPEVIQTYANRIGENSFSLPFALDSAHRGMILITSEGKLAGMVVSGAKAGDYMVVLPKVLTNLLLGN
ncbi:MAG: hypothetical protein A2806_03785 [Candidatus Terrybacteria bacterium RIFCSPHIGHO2_01_FULL_48_17]|uniref:Serine protease n=1 Tax=Candidatus Terrybacteria bacterium RIFCSPHIGHO2_01_FULL_48_17 TaxID=1802362 RepID=A0A1G2PIA3_9BACT|nr:MAG: hypothetical protein A2806_03785 [Candidatus Terrybacteria bacterium RIFCSPHIGHO2_01_FULL_48_17]OHA53922.1 MAG: hypothetical protein A3A30_03845 [Candidatus Terrybacteria bacterium RIFCSPLOWO2_01_FULL_48_14]